MNERRCEEGQAHLISGGLVHLRPRQEEMRVVSARREVRRTPELAHPSRDAGRTALAVVAELGGGEGGWPWRQHIRRRIQRRRWRLPNVGGTTAAHRCRLRRLEHHDSAASGVAQHLPRT